MTDAQLHTVETTRARPFLKWAGGKGQLLAAFETFYPPELKEGRIARYVEPFLGGGAVFFEIAQQYQIKEAFLSDANPELILAYTVVQKEVEDLLAELDALARIHLKKGGPDREEHFYDVRQAYNRERNRIKPTGYSKAWVPRAAKMLFLNKTCFNGLFRMNRKGEFNVPYGRYAKPSILDPDNLRRASEVLSGAVIKVAGFESVLELATGATFIYYDPPYRPISRTSSFTSYSADDFNEADQRRLADVFRKAHEFGTQEMLSNSDPKNENPEDTFFEELYRGFNINRVSAKRMINCKGDSRGQIKELVITNYAVDTGSDA